MGVGEKFGKRGLNAKVSAIVPTVLSFCQGCRSARERKEELPILSIGSARKLDPIWAVERHRVPWYGAYRWNLRKSIESYRATRVGAGVEERRGREEEEVEKEEWEEGRRIPWLF